MCVSKCELEWRKELQCFLDEYGLTMLKFCCPQENQNSAKTESFSLNLNHISDEHVYGLCFTASYSPLTLLPINYLPTVRLHADAIDWRSCAYSPWMKKTTWWRTPEQALLSIYFQRLRLAINLGTGWDQRAVHSWKWKSCVYPASQASWATMADDGK